MNDEEQKALKVVNKRTERLIEELKIEEEDLIDEPKIAYLITQIEANKTILNLIEKQSKEIEELKDKNKTLKNLQNDTNGLYIGMIERKNYFERELQNADKKWNNKIKAKIEEYEEKIKKIKEKDVWEEPYDTEKYVRYTNYISVLQSLLEKE